MTEKRSRTDRGAGAAAHAPGPLPLLSIAGSDPSGGAGIQADLKTFLAHGHYGMAVLTSLTAQNTLGVTAIAELEIPFIRAQLDAVFADIPPRAVKIGMLANAAVVAAVADALEHYRPPCVVLDPVMVSTSGSLLLEASALAALRERLFPLADLLTPNLREAELLWGRPIRSRTEMEAAAAELAARCGTALLLKGGHLAQSPCDCLAEGARLTCFEGERIANPNSHGTGCTLSSAIAARLAEGKSAAEACRLAKAYVAGALRRGFDLGQGRGPLDHGYALRFPD